MTTVGYGDMVPETIWGQVLCVIQTFNSFLIAFVYFEFLALLMLINPTISKSFYK